MNREPVTTTTHCPPGYVDAIDLFEELVLSQTHAMAPWQPVTDYSVEARTVIEGIHPQLIKEVFRPRLVIDVGAGNGFLAGQLRDGTISVVEADLNPAPNQVRFNLAIACDYAEGMFDLVICREVLEHLTLLQIRRAVTNLCTLSSHFVYVTTRFSSEHDLLRVETQDDLDPTHITLPSKDLIRLLFVLEGLRRRADLEERIDWQHKHRCLVYERAC